MMRKSLVMIAVISTALAGCDMSGTVTKRVKSGPDSMLQHDGGSHLVEREDVTFGDNNNQRTEWYVTGPDGRRHLCRTASAEGCRRTLDELRRARHADALGGSDGSDHDH